MISEADKAHKALYHTRPAWERDGLRTRLTATPHVDGDVTKYNMERRVHLNQVSKTYAHQCIQIRL